MKPVNSIDRSFQNQRNEVIETDVPKSGDNLTYRNHLGGLVLGRLYPQSIQHVLPNEKFSGSNEANLTFEQLSTPVIDDVDVCVHNFFVTLRSLDNRWEKFMTPTKLNNMNKNVSVPTFDMSRIISAVVTWLSSFVTLGTSDSRKYFDITIPTSFSSWDFVYHSDAVLDLLAQLRAITGQDEGVSVTLFLDSVDDVAKLQNFFVAVFDFFIGKRSLLDYFGYKMITHDQILNAFTNKDDVGYFSSAYAANYLFNSSTKLHQYLYNIAGAESTTLPSNFIVTYDSSEDEWLPTSYPLQNEYALRAYYSIWFEYYRNYDLEPRSASLPEYHDFGASSIFGSYGIADLHYLVPRIRSWQQDAFTTAGIDDISRHVYAPVSGAPLFDVQDDTSLMPSVYVGNNLISQQISWRNPSTGSVSTIDVPMPARLLSSLSSFQSESSDYSVELFSLKKAQMLENYLKRIYYGGDEYRDRMLHIYGARIEDYRINRPQWLSSSLDTINIRQEVANTGVAPGSAEGWSAGSRLATATAVQSGSDGFTQFSSEFGVYISILSIMPHATYDPYLLQNLQVAYTDFPVPQFANQMEDVISAIEISRQVTHTAFGYAPYGHAYRYRVDEVHGDFHDEKYDYVFLRFFDVKNIPNLSWSFIHCRPKLPMFVNSVLLDGQVYGTFKHNFLVEHPLPSPVEYI